MTGGSQKDQSSQFRLSSRSAFFFFVAQSQRCSVASRTCCFSAPGRGRMFTHSGPSRVGCLAASARSSRPWVRPFLSLSRAPRPQARPYLPSQRRRPPTAGTPGYLLPYSALFGPEHCSGLAGLGTPVGLARADGQHPPSGPDPLARSGDPIRDHAVNTLGYQIRVFGWLFAGAFSCFIILRYYLAYLRSNEYFELSTPGELRDDYDAFERDLLHQFNLGHRSPSPALTSPPHSEHSTSSRDQPHP